MVKLFDLSKRGHSSPTCMSLATNTNINKTNANLASSKANLKNKNCNVTQDRILASLSSSESREPVSLSRLPKIESMEREHKRSAQTSSFTHSKKEKCSLETYNYVNYMNNMESEFLPLLRKDVDGVIRQESANGMPQHHEEQEHKRKGYFQQGKNNEFTEARLHHHSCSTQRQQNDSKKVENVNADTNIITHLSSQNFNQAPWQQLEESYNSRKQVIDKNKIHSKQHENDLNTMSNSQLKNEEVYKGLIRSRGEPTLSLASAQTSEYHNHVIHEYLSIASPLMIDNKQSQSRKEKKRSFTSYNNIITTDNNYADEQKKAMETQNEVLVSPQLYLCELPEIQNSSSQVISQSPFLTSSLPPSHSPSFTPTPPSTTFTAIRASPFARSTSCEDSFLRSVSGNETSIEQNEKKTSLIMASQTPKCELLAPKSRLSLEIPKVEKKVEAIVETNRSGEERKSSNDICSSSSNAVHEVSSYKAMISSSNKSFSVLHELVSELQSVLGVLNEEYVRIDNETGEIVATNIHEIKVERVCSTDVYKERKKNSGNANGSEQRSNEPYVYVAKCNDDEMLPLLRYDLSMENVTTNYSSTSSTGCQDDTAATATAINDKTRSIGNQENANELLQVLQLSHQGYVNVLSSIWLVRLTLPNFPCISELMYRSTIQKQKELKRTTSAIGWVHIDNEQELLSYWHSATHWLTLLELFFMQCISYSLNGKDNMEYKKGNSIKNIANLESFIDEAYSVMNKEMEVEVNWKEKMEKELREIVSLEAQTIQSFTDVNNLECLPESLWLPTLPRCSFTDHVTYFLRPCASLYEFRKDELHSECLNRTCINTYNATTKTETEIETAHVREQYAFRLFMGASQLLSIPDDIFSAAEIKSKACTSEEYYCHCENDNKEEEQEELHNINKQQEKKHLLLSEYMNTSSQASHLHTRLAYSFVYEAQHTNCSDECQTVNEEGGGVATGLYSTLIQQLPEASFVDCMLMLAKLHYTLWELQHNNCQNTKMYGPSKQPDSSVADFYSSRDDPVRLFNLFNELLHDVHVNNDKNNDNNESEQKEVNGVVNLTTWCDKIAFNSQETTIECNSASGYNVSTCEYRSLINKNKKETCTVLLWHVVKRIKTFFVHKTETQLAELIQALLEDLLEQQQEVQLKYVGVTEQTTNKSKTCTDHSRFTECSCINNEHNDKEMAKDLHDIACFLVKLLNVENEYITLVDQFVSDRDKYVNTVNSYQDKEMETKGLQFLHELLSVPVAVDTLFTYAKPEPFSSTERNGMRKSRLYGNQSNFVEAVRLQYYIHLVEYTLELQNTIVSIFWTQNVSKDDSADNGNNEWTELVPVQTLDSYSIIKELSTFAETTKFCSSPSIESTNSTQDTSPMHRTPETRKPLWLRRSISPSAPININNAVTAAAAASSLSISSFSASCSSPSLLAKMSSPFAASSPLMLLLLHQKRHWNSKSKIGRRRRKRILNRSSISSDSKCQLFLPASATVTLSSMSSFASSEPSSSPLSTCLSEEHNNNINSKTHNSHLSTRSNAPTLTLEKDALQTFAELNCGTNTPNTQQQQQQQQEHESSSLSPSPFHSSTSSMEDHLPQESREGSRSQLYRLDTQTPHHPERYKNKMYEGVSQEENSKDEPNKPICEHLQELITQSGDEGELECHVSISVQSLSTYSINSSCTPTLSIVTTSEEPNSPISPEFSEKISYGQTTTCSNCSDNNDNNKYDNVLIPQPPTPPSAHNIIKNKIYSKNNYKNYVSVFSGSNDEYTPQSAVTLMEESKRSNSTVDVYRDISIVNSPTSIHESTLPFTHAQEIMSSIAPKAARNKESTPLNITTSMNSLNDESYDASELNRKDTRVDESTSPSPFVPLRIVFDTLVNFCTHKSTHEVAEYLHHLLLLYMEQRNIEKEDSDSETNINVDDDNDTNNKINSHDTASFHNNISEENKELSSIVLQQCTDEELFGPLLEQHSVNSSKVSNTQKYLCDELVVNVQDLASFSPLVLFY